MNIVDKLLKTETENKINDKEYFALLSSALKDYHIMVNKGIIVPKGSTVQFLYHPTKIKCNISR